MRIRAYNQSILALDRKLPDCELITFHTSFQNSKGHPNLSDNNEEIR